MVALKNNFSVTVGDEAVSILLKLRPQFPIVQYASVKHAIKAQLEICHGLRCHRREVNNREPSGAKGNPAALHDATIIGPTLCHRVC
jgi:hypothetical protein